MAARKTQSKVDLNEATREQLIELGRLTPALADAVLEQRKAGPVAAFAALADLPGVGPATLRKLQEAFEVQEKPQAQEDSASSQPAQRRQAELRIVPSQNDTTAREAAAAPEPKPAASEKPAPEAAPSPRAQAPNGAANGAEPSPRETPTTPELAVPPPSEATRQARAASKTVERELATNEFTAPVANWASFWPEQMAEAWHAAMEMTRCRTPVEVAAVQRDFVLGSYQRLVDRFMPGLGMETRQR
jgi:Helix-hairpin-helix motif